nr:probable RNA-binding protein ARP1 [Tanacetum cinerariifolium]
MGAAAADPYLNMVEGGHGNYTMGQSYVVYPYHLYQYSTMNSSRGDVHRRKRCSTITRCSSLRYSCIDLFEKMTFAPAMVFLEGAISGL